MYVHLMHNEFINYGRKIVLLTSSEHYDYKYTLLIKFSNYYK